MDINVNGSDFGAVVNCAVRYAVGRATYMPHLVVDFITPILSELDDTTLFVMRRDIEESDSLGDPRIDAPKWRKLLLDINLELLHQAKK